MVDQLLLLFQALFLVLLYLFIWRVVATASRDLRLPQESFLLTPGQLGGRAVAEAPPQGRLLVERSPSLAAGEAFAIGAAPLTIGRSGDNAVAIPADEFASTRHARIEPRHDGLWLVDLDSTNGTLVNGEPIEGRVQLFDGDLVRVGDTELRVEG